MTADDTGTPTDDDPETDEPKPCPQCGHQEHHDPVEAEIAENHAWMTVMCSNCGKTFQKPAEHTSTDTDTRGDA